MRCCAARSWRRPLAGLPRTLVLEAVRAEVALARDRLRANGGAAADAGALAAAAAERAGLARAGPRCAGC